MHRRAFLTATAAAASAVTFKIASAATVTPSEKRASQGGRRAASSRAAVRFGVSRSAPRIDGEAQRTNLRPFRFPRLRRHDGR